MIKQIPHYEQELEVLNLLTGEIKAGYVIGYANDQSRVVEHTEGYLPLFKYLNDPDGDWIEVNHESNEWDRDLYDPYLLRYKS